MEETLRTLVDLLCRFEIQLEEIREEMAKVSANSSVVVSTVESHGDAISRLEKGLTKIDLHCPLMALAQDKCSHDQKNSNRE